MNYLIKAHPTVYDGVQYRSRLEARWAAFFDLILWEHQYEPIDFVDWTPDFYVKVPCGHSECPGYHDFYAEVKPYNAISQFKGHPVIQNSYGEKYGTDGGLALGIDPTVAQVELMHGAGGGVEGGREFFAWRAGDPTIKISDIDLLWKAAGNSVQYIVHR